MTDAATARDRWTAAGCRTSRQLFATCGAAGASGVEPRAATVLTALAGQFAWHAELYYDLLPVRAGVDREALVDLAVRGADDALRYLDDVAARGDVAAASGVLARVVVPRLTSGVDAAREVTNPDLDGPRARTLTLVGRDLVDARGELESLLERLVVDGDTLDSVGRACLAAERCLVDGGVRVGLWPDAEVA